MLQLLAIFGALLVGYAFRRLPLSERHLNYGLTIIVVLILFVMGYELGSRSEHLLSELAGIGRLVLIFTLTLFILNFSSGWLFLGFLNRSLKRAHHQAQRADFKAFILVSGKYIAMVVVGIIAGKLIHHPLGELNQVISGLLFILLFIVGHQMRASGIALRQIVLNRNGIIVALIIAISSLIGGIIAAVIAGIPLRNGLIFSSGFGWYTLASILTGSLLGQQAGTVAFFIDFSRELLAIILIPSLGQLFPATMVGYSGGTAMDFTLPIIKQNLDERCVLLAISSGMLLSLAVPILIPLWARL